MISFDKTTDDGEEQRVFQARASFSEQRSLVFDSFLYHPSKHYVQNIID